MSSSDIECHVEEEEEEELLLQHGEPRQPRACVVVSTLALGLGLLACALGALAWSSSPPSWSAGSDVVQLGMVKPKEYDWKDSNRAMFGSNEDKEVKKESAADEDAWVGAGKKTGLEVWRINKLRVERVPDFDGKFYSGDSYILLNTYKKTGSDELHYDVHFWIGKYSTKDEYGMAVFKTMELDNLLGGKPVQHREVQGRESALFKSYFKSMSIMKGGADSAFRTKAADVHAHRLIKVGCDEKTCRVAEVPKKLESLDNEHAFVLDVDLTIYQINGAGASHKEKFRAAAFVQELAAGRSKPVKHEVTDVATARKSQRIKDDFE
jgi:gelsolin